LKVKHKRYWIEYTGLFCLLFFVCYAVWFIHYDKAFIRYVDGLEQHYVSYVYIGDWLREIARTLIRDHKLIFPMWDESIGFGSDVFLSMYGGFTDPLYWGSVFIPTKYAEYGFDAMIVIKCWLCGWSYSCFALHKGKEYWPTLLGAVTYTFSGTMMLVFIESPCITWMYLLPFVMMGTCDIWENKNGRTYLIALAVSFFFNFYFSYMICLVVFFYCIVRLFVTEIPQGITLREVSNKVIKFLGYSITAAGLAAVSIIPFLCQLFSSERLHTEYYIPRFFTSEYYGKLLGGFISFVNMSSRDCYMGFAAVTLPLVITLFLLKKKHTVLKVGFFLMTIGLGVPYFGHVMNGMSYTSNRWVGAYCLCVAYIVTVVTPQLHRLTRKKCVIVLLAVILYAGLTMGLLEFRALNMVAATMAAAIFTLVMFALTAKPMKQKRMYAIVLIAMITCLPVKSIFSYSDTQENVTAYQVSSGTAYSSFFGKILRRTIEKLDMSNGIRYDERGLRRVRNANWITGLNGIDFYMNVCNNNIEEFNSDISLITAPYAGGYHDLNQRAEIEALMGVKYYVINVYTQGENELPAEYDEEEELDTRWEQLEVYTTGSDVSMVYGFEDSIPYSEYEELSPIDKQQTIMKSVVVDDAVAEDTVRDLDNQECNVEYELKLSDEVTKSEDGKLIAKNDGATFDLEFEKQEDAEIYVYFEGLDYRDGDTAIYKISLNALNGDQEIPYMIEDLNLTNYRAHMYVGRFNWMVHMGYAEDAVDTIRITLPFEGEYELESLKVYARKGDDIAANIEGLKPITDEVITERYSNTVEFEADNRTPYNWIFVSIPYSTGWKATLNGEDCEVYKADTGFIAIRASGEDANKATMSYCTPGLRCGAMITIITFALIVLFGIFNQRKEKEEGKRNEKH